MALAAVIALVLLAPASGSAAKIRHVGQIVKLSDSKVTLRVTKRRGQITKISRLKVQGAKVRCPSGNYRFAFGVTGSVRVSKKGNFRARLPNVNDDSEKLRLTGRVLRRGKKVVGNFKTNSLTQTNGERCDVPKQRFATRKA
jgi:hypothetical protein